MENTEKNNLELINLYLEQNYYIQDNTFINIITKTPEWSREVIKPMGLILSIDNETIFKGIISWITSKGMLTNQWTKSYSAINLKTSFKLSQINDLEQILGSNAEKQIIKMFCNDVSKEIGYDILKFTSKIPINFIELENLMLCIGYTFTGTMYDQYTFATLKGLVSITEYQQKYEQQNNPYWKDWFRARGQNEKTQESSFLEKDGYDIY